MGSKNLKKLLALVVVLVICIGFYVWFDNYKSNQDKDKKEDTSQVLVDVSKKDTLTEIKYKNNGKTVTLKYNSKEKEWYNAKHKSWPINQENITSMTNALNKVVATRKLDTEEELSEYGLEKPDLIIDYSTKKGKKYTLNIGKDVSSGDSNYCTLGEKKDIYLVESTIKTAFQYTEERLIEVEKIPSITSNLVYDVNAKGKKFNLKAKYDGDITNSDSGEWKITKPYKDTLRGMSSSFTDYFVNFESLSFDECVDIEPKKLSKYGFNDPTLSIALKYMVEDSSSSKSEKSDKKKYKKSEYTLLIGKEIYEESEDEDGEKSKMLMSYYAMKKGGNRVYTIDASTIENILSAKPFNFIFNAVNNTDLNQYKNLKITKGDKKYTVTKTKETNAKGDVSVTYKFNKKKYDEADGDQVYSSITELVYAKEIGNKKIKKDKTIAKLEFKGKEKGAKDTVIKILNYDDNYYRINQDGKEYFLVSKVEMDNALKEVINACK